jgi:hypothetical protein
MLNRLRDKAAAEGLEVEALKARGRELLRRLRGAPAAQLIASTFRFDHHVKGWPRLSVDHSFHPLCGSENEV